MMWDPFHGDVEAANKAYIACGKVAIHWGHLELTVEALIVILRNRQKAPSTQDGRAFVDFPVSFSKKRNEIKDRMKADPIFHDLVPQAVKLLGEAAQLHDVRVIITHSVCQGVMLNGQLMFTHSDQKRGVSATSKYLTFKRIDAASARMRTLQVELEKLHVEMHRRWLARGAPPYVPASPRASPAGK
jgi:hypothetical protein